VEVCGQPIERPTGEGQIEAAWVGQGKRDDLASLFGCVRRRSPSPWAIPQAVKPIGVEPLEPEPDRIARQAELASDGWHAPALIRQPDDLRSLDGARRRRAGLGQLSNGRQLVGGEWADLECDRKPAVWGYLKIISLLDSTSAILGAL
jgi:hypothetical protein